MRNFTSVNYHTSSEVIGYLQSQLDNPIETSGNSSITGTKSFTGTKSARAYIDMYKYGWKEGRESLKHSMDELLPKTKAVLETSNIGFAPSIPDYLSGNPENMFTMDNQVQKIVNIVVPMGWSADIEQKHILAYGGVVATVLKSLIDSGYKVNLKSYFAVSLDGKRCIDIIDIVKVGDILDVDKIASCFHTSFFRRGYFALEEFSKEKHYTEASLGGYGHSLPRLTKEEVQQHVDSNEHVMLFPELSSTRANQKEVLDKAIEEVKQTINAS